MAIQTPKLRPCLWFDGKAEEAARFYASIFPNSSVDLVERAPSDYPAGKAGDVLMVEFTLMGMPFAALNGGPEFKFNEALSFQIPVETQAEADRYVEALSAHPEAEICGWLKDRYGLSWQIMPSVMTKWLTSPDQAASKRVFEAMMGMKRLDLAALDAAGARR